MTLLERPLRPAVTEESVTVAWIGRQLLLLVAMGLVYFGVRGITRSDTDAAVGHAHDLVTVEGLLALDVEDELQGLFLRFDAVHTLANWVYIWGHWPVIVATLVWLARRHRTHYLRLRNGMAVSGFLGMFVFWLYPMAPPRLSGLGYVDTITETSASYRILQPPAFVNEYAAMPSLHCGWDLLVGMALAAVGGVAVRRIGYLLPVLMAFAVVVTGNHYVLDVVAGCALALAGHGAALWWEGRPLAPTPAVEAGSDQPRVHSSVQE